MSAEQGGSITSSDENGAPRARLDIPPGALPADTVITIETRVGQTIPGFVLASPVYSFGPEGTVFNLPVRVTIPFTGDAAGKAVFWSLLGDTTQFEVMPTEVGAGEMVAYVTHFSEGFAGGSDNPACASANCAAPQPSRCADDTTLEVFGHSACDATGTCVAQSAMFDCGAVINGTGACADGACVRNSCNLGFDDCDNLDASGCETDLSYDVANCGSCGNACAAGQACVAGSCQDVGCSVDDDCPGAFVACDGSTALNVSFTCIQGTCTPQPVVDQICPFACAQGLGCVTCNSDAQCPPAESVCDVNGDLQSTSHRCDATGTCVAQTSTTSCAAGDLCVEGACITPECQVDSDCGTEVTTSCDPQSSDLVVTAPACIQGQCSTRVEGAVACSTAGPGVTCSAGNCVSSVVCARDSDCFAYLPFGTCADNHCVLTRCESTGTCADAVACSGPTEFASQSRQCVPVATGVSACMPGALSYTSCQDPDQCYDGACIPPGTECVTVEDCAGGGAPTCSGNVATYPAGPVDCEAGYCVNVPETSAPCDVACVDGVGCVACAVDGDCAAYSTGTCNGNSVVNVAPACVGYQCVDQGGTVEEPCPASTVCLSGVCAPEGTECVTAADCPSGGFTCAGPGDLAVTSAECIDGMCESFPSGELYSCSYISGAYNCDPSQGMCVGNACGSNSDCFGFADTCVNGQCEARQCDTAADCAPYNVCFGPTTAASYSQVCYPTAIPGVQVCANDSPTTVECTNGDICIRGECAPPECAVDADCTNGPAPQCSATSPDKLVTYPGTCNAGVCNYVPLETPCNYLAAPPNHATCSAGTCVLDGWVCQTDADCPFPPLDRCTNGQCVPNECDPQVGCPSYDKCDVSNAGVEHYVQTCAPVFAFNLCSDNYPDYSPCPGNNGPGTCVDAVCYPDPGTECVTVADCASTTSCLGDHAVIQEARECLRGFCIYNEPTQQDCGAPGFIGCMAGVGCMECDDLNACAPQPTGQCADATSVEFETRACVNYQCEATGTTGQACPGTDICLSGACAPEGTECVTPSDCNAPAPSCPDGSDAITFSSASCLGGTCDVATDTLSCAAFDRFGQPGTCGGGTCVRNSPIFCSTSYNCYPDYEGYDACVGGVCSMVLCDTDDDCNVTPERGCEAPESAWMITMSCVPNAYGLKVCRATGPESYQSIPCQPGTTCNESTGLCQ
ncbi:MAG: hypothetical protein AB2A00_13670 [Myxococcota bacterium]